MASDESLFTAQLDGCRTFEDEGWATYWRDLAQVHLDAADAALAILGAPKIPAILGQEGESTAAELGSALAPAVDVFVPRTRRTAVRSSRTSSSSTPNTAPQPLRSIRLVKAMVYLFAASWPGWSPARLRAYGDSQRIMHVLLMGLAPAMDVHAERITLNIAGEQAVAYGVFPAGDHQGPAVLVSNGLESLHPRSPHPCTAPAAPRHRHGHHGNAQYLPVRPTALRRVRGHVRRRHRAARHPPPDRRQGAMGMMGISFGAHWSTRMAARSPRLRAVVSNGGLSPRLGRRRHPRDARNLLWTLRTQSAPRTSPASATASTLFPSGSSTAGSPSRSSRSTATLTPSSAPRTPSSSPRAHPAANFLYPNDDHCAMGHYTEWLDHASDWFIEKLA